MTVLDEIFAELGLTQYLPDFLDQGFDTWETILDIKESDFDVLGVKLGHRRKLQRRIANTQGLSSERALQSPKQIYNEERAADEQKPAGAKTEQKTAPSVSQGAKRKYRRHPKPDENAPERSPSAYVLFSNKMREDLKGRNLSFTEIAKLVGEHWQHLLPAGKEPYEQQAFVAKEKYHAELAEYKKTDKFREYSRYLADFKARQANQQQGDAEPAKRPKLEERMSIESSGTGSSVTSPQSDAPISRIQFESAASVGSWYPSETQPSPQPTTLSQINMPLGLAKAPASPPLVSSAGLSGYRDSVHGVGPAAVHQSGSWLEGRRDGGGIGTRPQIPQTSSVEDRYSSAQKLSVDSLNLTSSVQRGRRIDQSHSPPALTSQPTNTSTNSTASSGSSTQLSPHTPMEPPLDRALPIPQRFSQKLPTPYEHQLPPLSSLAASAGSASLGALRFSTGIHNIPEFAPTMPPIRAFTGALPQIVPNDLSEVRMPEYISAGSAEDENLDPVSALLRAGEIVSRGSRGL